jgi:hypothetical protein
MRKVTHILGDHKLMGVVEKNVNPDSLALKDILLLLVTMIANIN